VTAAAGEGARPPVRVAAAVVFRGPTVLLTQRPPGGARGLMWEFPGGKIEAGESAAEALRREIEEELGVASRPLEVLAVHRHDYPDGLGVEIAFVRCELDSLEFIPSAAVHAVRWIAPGDVKLEEILAGDREFLTALARVRS
jgi:8-oxo-dGTP diphosphatase